MIYRVTEVSFIVGEDDMKRNKRASISEIVNEHLASNPHLEPVSIHSDYDHETRTYYIKAWFKYGIEEG